MRESEGMAAYPIATEREAEAVDLEWSALSQELGNMARRLIRTAERTTSLPGGSFFRAGQAQAVAALLLHLSETWNIEAVLGPGPEGADRGEVRC